MLEPQSLLQTLPARLLPLPLYPLSPVLLRLQRLQRDVQLRRSSAQPRWSGEGSQHHPVPLQEIPAEEAEERKVDERRDHGERHTTTQNINKNIINKTPGLVAEQNYDLQ